MCGCIAQLVEHRTSIAEVTGSSPVEALIFFRLLYSNCLNWKFTAKITYHLQKYTLLRKTTTNATTPVDPMADLSQPTGYMTTSDESPREVGSSTGSLLGPKTNIRLATWNVRTMLETSKPA